MATYWKVEYVLTWLHKHYCIKPSFQPSTRAVTWPAGIMLSAERTDRETLGVCALTIARPTKSRFARPTERRTTTNASTNWTCARRKGTLRSRILEVAEVSMLDWYCWCCSSSCSVDVVAAFFFAVSVFLVYYLLRCSCCFFFVAVFFVLSFVPFLLFSFCRCCVCVF